MLQPTSERPPTVATELERDADNVVMFACDLQVAFREHRDDDALKAIHLIMRRCKRIEPWLVAKGENDEA